MKEMINKSIEYLKKVYLNEPTKIRVEETGSDIIVLSFLYSDNNYNWEARVFKQFIFKEDEVMCMLSFNN